MSFQATYTLAAGFISLTGLFFLIFGLRQLVSRRFGLSWRSLLREAWREMLGKRQASGRGSALYFALFGLFMILFCSGATALLWLGRMIMPDAAAPLPSPPPLIEISC